MTDSQVFDRLKARTKLNVMFDHGSTRRTAFWFKINPNGDIMTAPGIKQVGKLYTAVRPSTTKYVPPEERELVAGDGVEPLGRTHATLHPSRVGVPGKASSVVNLHQLTPNPMDLRTLNERAIVMTHQLMEPGVYSPSTVNGPGILLGQVFAHGAPTISLHVTPIEDGKAIDSILAPAPQVYSFALQGITDDKRDYLFQLAADWDRGAFWADTHCFSLPRTYAEDRNL